MNFKCHGRKPVGIYWEQSQSKGPVPSAAKYVDQSYLREAVK